MSYPRRRTYGSRSYHGSTTEPPSRSDSPATPKARPYASSSRTATTAYQPNGTPASVSGWSEAASPGFPATRSKFKLTVHLIRDAPPQFEVSMRAISSPVSKLAFPSPASPAVGTLTPTRVADNALFVNHMAPDSPAVKIHEKFVVLVSPTAAIEELKKQLQVMYLRLYPRHAPITVLRVQDSEFSDVFDEYTVSDVFADLDSFYAIVTADGSTSSTSASTDISTNVSRKRSLELDSSGDMQTPKRARPDPEQETPLAAAKKESEPLAGRIDVNPEPMTNGIPKPAPVKPSDLPHTQHVEIQQSTHQSPTAAKAQSTTVASPAPQPLPRTTPEKSQMPTPVGFETPLRPAADRKPVSREPLRTSAAPVKIDPRPHPNTPTTHVPASSSANTNAATPTRPLPGAPAMANRPGVLSEVVFSSSSSSSDSDSPPSSNPDKVELPAPSSHVALKPAEQASAPILIPKVASAPAPLVPSNRVLPSTAISTASITPVKLEASTDSHTFKPRDVPQPISQSIVEPERAPPSPEPMIKLEPSSTFMPPASPVVRIDSPVYISSTTDSSSESDSDSEPETETESSSVAETATDSESASVTSSDTTTDSSLDSGSSTNLPPSSLSTLAATVPKQPASTSKPHSTRLPLPPKDSSTKLPATVAKQSSQPTMENRSTVPTEPAVATQPNPKPKPRNPFQAPAPSTTPATAPTPTRQPMLASGGRSSLASHGILKKGNFASLSAIAASGSFRNLEHTAQLVPGTRGTGLHSAKYASSSAKSGDLYVNSDSEEESDKQASVTDSEVSSSGSDSDSDSSSDSDSDAKSKQSKKSRVVQPTEPAAPSRPPVAIKVAGSRTKKRKSRLAKLSSMF